MSGPIARHPEPLPAGHPCERCCARERAVCRVLDCESLAEFKNLGATLTMPAGQTLFRDGEAATRVFTLTRGSLKLEKPVRRGRRRIVGFLSAGDFLGVSAGRKQAFAATMTEDGELCSFAYRRFGAFIAGHPAMERELIENGFHEISAARLQRSLLGRETAAARIATFLLAFAERSGLPLADPPQSVRLPMSRADLADYLDVSEQTLASMLSRLEVARLIRSVNPREVEILNWRLLEELAGYEGAARLPAS